MSETRDNERQFHRMSNPLRRLSACRCFLFTSTTLTARIGASQSWRKSLARLKTSPRTLQNTDRTDFQIRPVLTGSQQICLVLGNLTLNDSSQGAVQELALKVVSSYRAYATKRVIPRLLTVQSVSRTDSYSSTMEGFWQTCHDDIRALWRHFAGPLPQN